MGSSTADGTGGARNPVEPASAGSPSTKSAPVGRGRTFGSGSGRVALAALAGLILVGAGLLVGRGGSRSSHGPAAAQAARYGGLPAWLPTPKVKSHRLLHASLAHPVLTIQGEGVSVGLSGARVLATAVGPEVPEEGHFPVPEVTPATFVVTFASASRALPLRGSAFTLVDERGRLRHPKMTALDGGAPPSEIVPGHTVSVRLHDILPTGDGGLNWSEQGMRVATWDYTVEID